LSGWEPTPPPLGAEASPPPGAGAPGVAALQGGASPAARVLGGLAGLESLLAGLRSEFAEERGVAPRRREGRSAVDLPKQGGTTS